MPNTKPEQPDAPENSAQSRGGIPWLLLAVAVVGMGVIGWALGNANLARTPEVQVQVPQKTPPTVAPTGLLSATPPLLPAVQTSPPAVIPAVPPSAVADNQETLHNRIVLPAEWPPKNQFRPGEPMPVPYLSNPPPVINIDVGRQLFVDDFLIESTTLKRVFHRATMHSNNPVLKPDQAWEQAGGAPMALPFSDGVWFDPWSYPARAEFTLAELVDPGALVAKLTAHTNALTQHLWNQFPPASQAALTNHPAAQPVAPALAEILLREFNRLIRGVALFEPGAFTGLRLTEQTAAWLSRQPTGEALARLNRLLLEDSFPREIPRRPAGFRAYYMAGYGQGTALAVSTNGIHWEKPDLGIRPGSNLVQTDPRDSSTVWLDQTDADPTRRYKMFRSHSEDGRFGLSVHFSGDGIHWAPRVLRTGSAGDRTTVFQNPFRKVWVYSLRHGWGEPRARRYWEVKDLLAGPHWNAITEPPMWTGADRLDLPRADLQVPPQLYNLDAIACESLMVGLFTLWRGDKNIPEGRPKPNSVWLGFSRDGYHWDRPDRRPFLEVSEQKGDWNWGNVQSAGGGFLVVGRNLHFYFSGRAGAPGQREAGGAMGLATLRRDGFASMDAGPETLTLTTRPLLFTQGRQLFLNMKTNAPDGAVSVEVVHADDRPIELVKNDTKERLQPFTLTNAMPATMDTTLMSINWNNFSADLSVLWNRPVKFRFHVKNASLYSFWVSPSRRTGLSNGYTAAGGPHFTGPVDTIGNRSYSAFNPAPPPVPIAAPSPAPPAPAAPK